MRWVPTYRSGHRVGRLAGGGMQMSGVFLIYNGAIVSAQRADSAGDRFDDDRLFANAADAAG